MMTDYKGYVISERMGGCEVGLRLPNSTYHLVTTAPDLSQAKAWVDRRAYEASRTYNKLEDELNTARHKALDSLARYKFQMFGYWAAIWVHLNRLGGFNKPNPFKTMVKQADNILRGDL